MTAKRLDDTGRWWRIDGHDIDLLAEWVVVPNVRIALLLARDAETDEERDLAEVLAWVVEDHPGWDGGCTTCGTSGMCPTQVQINSYGLEWLSAAALRRAASLASKVTELEGKRRERSA